MCDLRQAWALGLSRNAVYEFVGDTPDGAPERHREASPAERLPLGVPQVLIHGALDDDVPVAMSAEYATTARGLGDEMTLTILPQSGRLDLIDPESEAWPVVLQAVHSATALAAAQDGIAPPLRNRDGMLF